MCAAASVSLLTACGGQSSSGGDVKADIAPSNSKAMSVEADSPIDQPFSMKDAEALDVEAFLALFPLEVRPEYKAAEFDEKLGATVLTHLRFPGRIANDDGDVQYSVEYGGMTVERAEFFGVDLEAIEAVKAAEGAGVSAPLKNVASKVRFFGVSFDTQEQASNTEAKIAAIEIDRLALREGAFTQENANPSAAFFNSFSFGGLYFKDFDLTTVTEDAGKSRISFTAPDVRLVGGGGGKLSTLIANQLKYSVDQDPELLKKTFGGADNPILNNPLASALTPASQRSNIESFVWRDIDFSKLLAFGMDGVVPPTSERDLIDLGSMTVLNSESFVGEKLFARQAKSEVTAMEFDWLLPSKIRTTSDDGFYDFTAYVQDGDQETLDVLKSYGLENVKADSDLTYDWDADSGESKLLTTFEAEGLADFKLATELSELKLSGIDDSDFEGSFQTFFQQAKLGAFEMTINDENLLNAAYGLSALSTGRSAEEARKSLPALVRVLGMQASLLNPKVSDYVNAVASFFGRRRITQRFSVAS